MMISLTVDEAIALLVAGEAVKLQYELDGDSLTTDAYISLAKAIKKLDMQVWERKEPNDVLQ